MATIPDPHLIPAIPTESAIASARAFAGVAITLNIIAFFTFGGRIWTRCFPVFRLAMDDYVISIGYVRPNPSVQPVQSLSLLLCHTECD